MNQTVYEKGLEQGLEQGLERGLERAANELRETVALTLEAKFGSFDATKLDSLSYADLRALIVKIPNANSVEDLLQ